MGALPGSSAAQRLFSLIWSRREHLLLSTAVLLLNVAAVCNTVEAGCCLVLLTLLPGWFGADLGAGFLDDQMQKMLAPSAVVLVATVRYLKYNGRQADITSC